MTSARSTSTPKTSSGVAGRPRRRPCSRGSRICARASRRRAASASAWNGDARRRRPWRSPRRGARALDHQVDVEVDAARTRSRSARRTSGPIDDRRDEVAVHDVDVDDRRPRPSTTSATCAPSRAKSAERIDGAIAALGRRGQLDLDQHRAATVRCSASSPSRTSARSSSARRSPGRPSAARSGAGSRRSGSGRGGSSGAATAPRSSGTRARSAVSASSTGNIEAVGAVAMRERAQTALAHDLLARRQRADRVDERPPAQPRGRSSRIASCSIRQAVDRLGRRAPAQVGVARSVPRPLHGGSTRTAVEARRGSKRAASASATTRTLVASSRSHVAASAARAAGGARPRRSRRRSPISAARCVVLPPGAAQRSSTRSPGCGSTARATRCDGARLRRDRPALHRADAARTSSGPVDDERVVLAAACRDRPSASTSGLMRSASSAGSLSAASSARVSSAPSQSHHSCTSHSGWE